MRFNENIFFQKERAERDYYIEELIRIGIVSHEGKMLKEMTLIELKRKLAIFKAVNN
jgi:hypothetical protein